MFFREKRTGDRSYLQLVENRWEEGRSRQRVIATFGRVEELRASGQFDALLASGARFSEAALVLAAHARGEAPRVSTRRIGPASLFERLGEEVSDQSDRTPFVPRCTKDLVEEALFRRP